MPFTLSHSAWSSLERPPQPARVHESASTARATRSRFMARRLTARQAPYPGIRRARLALGASSVQLLPPCFRFGFAREQALDIGLDLIDDVHAPLSLIQHGWAIDVDPSLHVDVGQCT